MIARKSGSDVTKRVRLRYLRTKPPLSVALGISP